MNRLVDCLVILGLENHRVQHETKQGMFVFVISELVLIKEEANHPPIFSSSLLDSKIH